MKGPPLSYLDLCWEGAARRCTGSIADDLPLVFFFGYWGGYVMKLVINVTEMNEELKNPPGLSSSAGPTITILARRTAARVTAVKWSWAQAICRVSMCTKHSNDYTLIVQWIILTKCFTGTDSFPQISLTTLLPSFSEWVWIFPVLEGLPFVYIVAFIFVNLSPPHFPPLLNNVHGQIDSWSPQPSAKGGGGPDWPKPISKILLLLPWWLA